MTRFSKYLLLTLFIFSSDSIFSQTLPNHLEIRISELDTLIALLQKAIEEESFIKTVSQYFVPIATTLLAFFALFVNFHQGKKRLRTEIVTKTEIEIYHKHRDVYIGLLDALSKKDDYTNLFMFRSHISLLPFSESNIKLIILRKIDLGIEITKILNEKEEEWNFLIEFYDTIEKSRIKRDSSLIDLVDEYEKFIKSGQEFSELQAQFIINTIDSINKNEPLKNKLENALISKIKLQGERHKSYEENFSAHITRFNVAISDMLKGTKNFDNFKKTVAIYNIGENTKLINFFHHVFIPNLSESFEEIIDYHWHKIKSEF